MTTARAFYEAKKASGMKHQAAVRALAFKWIRILFQMWKHRQPDTAHRDTPALIQAKSPLAKALEVSKNVTRKDRRGLRGRGVVEIPRDKPQWRGDYISPACLVLRVVPSAGCPRSGERS